MDQVHQQIQDAQRVLYNLAPDGSIISKSNLYATYEKNAATYAKAKSDYAEAHAKAQSNPAALQAWPLTATTYRLVVDSAWNTWVVSGKNAIEQALAIIESQSKNSRR